MCSRRRSARAEKQELLAGAQALGTAKLAFQSHTALGDLPHAARQPPAPLPMVFVDIHDKVPIRADMATIINGPTGMVESRLMSSTAPAMSSGVYQKRKQLQDRLISQFIAQHGDDPKTRAVVTKEVEKSGLMRAEGQLTGPQLAGLESRVAKAVFDTRPLGKRPEMVPPPNYAPPMPAGELATKVKESSNWTDVAMHRNGYYNIEIQRKIAQKEQQKAVLRTHMHHQMSLDQHKKEAERELVREEARQVAMELASYERDMAAEKKKKLAKVEVEKKARDAQMREQAARAAAAVRLQKLEDEEMEAFMRKEEEVARQKKEEKKRANAKYHAETAAANAQAKVLREAEKQKVWAEEAKLNAEWSAVLQKQEDARNAQYASLRERIHAMQRVYESSAGADLKARIEAEEAANERYVQQHEKMLDDQFEAKKNKRAKDIADNLAFLKMQEELKAKAKREEARQDKIYAAEVMKDVVLSEKQNEQRLALNKAKRAQQTASLTAQVHELKALKSKDPGSSEMTDLEAAINRPLLVSIVQHKYHANYSNPLTG